MSNYLAKYIVKVKNMKKNIRKNFIWNTIGSTLNATTSLFFLIIVTRLNGVDEAGLFTFAFSTSCLLQVIGTYFGRAYQVTERDKELTNNDFLFSRYITCGFMMISAIFFVIVKGYFWYKIEIILLLTFYKMIEAYSESIYAIIQRNDELYKVGISLFFKGLLGLFSFFLTDRLTKNLIISILSLLIVNSIILLFYDLRNIKQYDYKRKKFAISKVRKILKKGFFTFLFTLLTQYVINAPKYAIDSFMNDNYQAIFGIIIMPATLIILCGQFMIQPFLGKLTNCLNLNDRKEFLGTVFKIIGWLMIFGIVANILAGTIGIPFLEGIYGVKLKDYLNSLIIIVSGAILFGISYILSNALIAMRKTKEQCLIFLIASFFEFLISNKLVIFKEILGASLAYFFTMLFILIMYIIVFIREINRWKSGNK